MCTLTFFSHESVAVSFLFFVTSLFIYFYFLLSFFFFSFFFLSFFSFFHNEFEFVHMRGRVLQAVLKEVLASHSLMAACRDLLSELGHIKRGSATLSSSSCSAPFTLSLTAGSSCSATGDLAPPPPALDPEPLECLMDLGQPPPPPTPPVKVPGPAALALPALSSRLTTGEPARLAICTSLFLSAVGEFTRCCPT